MANKRVEEIAEGLCRPITERLGIELIDIEYKKEGTNFVLRIIIDKPGGIVIEDCENVSRELDEKLDETDPIDNNYNLEVQSPGERSLKRSREFEYFKGRDVEVKLYEALEQKKVFEGKLLGRDNEFIRIMDENEDVKEFPVDKVANVKLRIIF